ncbi:GNAT family N-acetyltransferase [Halovenus halobia]|uniref:GNAT family N-acetyltransferase n=1 Tax=Halovenus halobia TaxID=3396622 RepID=UPI003F564ABA
MSLQGPTIEVADHPQIDEIQSLFNQEQIKEEIHWFTYRDALERAVRRGDRAIFYIANADNDIIAASMVWCESRVLEKNQGQIRLIAVHPDARGQGLGRALVRESERFAADHNKQTMIAEVSAGTRAKDFWEKVGYSEVSHRSTENGREMVLMENDLND